MYHIETYLDAHDERADRIIKTSDLIDALHFVATEAKLLESEAEGFEYGPAGDDEMFEVFPTYGHGTVVLKEDSS